VPTPVPDRRTDAGPAALSDLFEHERGVIVVGPPSGVGTAREQERAEAIGRFAVAAAWPVIGEPLTHVRRADMGGALVVTAADLLLGDGGFSQEVVPEVVVRIGRAPTTKPVRLWLERHRPGRVVHVDSTQHWSDAGFTLTDHVSLDPARALAGGGPARSSSGWLDRWREAEELARAVISRTVDGGPLLSASVARILLGALSPQSLLMVSNSMPVRELDTFSGPELGPVVVGNRGASGIDGVNSTALGLAAARPDRSAALFTGDLALLHDLGGLLAAARLGLHLTIVCVDNHGGGIFSMLPIARRSAEVDFEQLFLTPPGIELTDLDGLGGIRARTVESGSDLADATAATMSTSSPGVDLLVVPVDGDADVAQHRAVAAAVSAELAARR
jgi:2-succinyl-5-enolpyruvyl-6-hydroxy-3-cyclohexene-1-carboxylate synthase